MKGFRHRHPRPNALRAAPRDSAQQQAALWQGDLPEIRGQRMDNLQGYDHRRERSAFVKASQRRPKKRMTLINRVTKARAPRAPGPA
jgi:hypothetical protein